MYIRIHYIYELNETLWLEFTLKYITIQLGQIDIDHF